MGNGEIVREIRALLSSETRISSAVATRLTLAAVADLYDKVSDLSTKVDVVQDVDARVDGLEKRVNAWSYANSAGVILAGVLAWFKH